jgi:eukaryotic-like serine/threonine-protein kinase
MSPARVIGQYEVQGLLGEGGSGQVYGARDTVLGRDVAIKSLRPELLNDASFVERFRAEATNLARLNHPNITTLYTLLADGKQLYMVMELVRGRTLETLLRERQGPLSPSEAIAIISQAADGLSYAHGVGIIHRDIKPANLIITDSGQLKIMDFSIARMQGSERMTRDGSIIGTLAYMSPEQLRAEDVDARTDLYSLAIVLYEMLSGSVPFTAASDYELMRAQIHNAPKRLKHQVAGLDPRIDKALMRALSKKPNDRYASVAAFKEALGVSKTQTEAEEVTREIARLGTTVIQVPPGTTVIQPAERTKPGLSPAFRGFAVVTAVIVVLGACAMAVRAMIDFGPATFGSREALKASVPSLSKRTEIAPPPSSVAVTMPTVVPSAPLIPMSTSSSPSASQPTFSKPESIEEPRVAIAPPESSSAERPTSKPPVASAPDESNEDTAPTHHKRQEHSPPRNRDVSSARVLENRNPGNTGSSHTIPTVGY